MELGSDTADLKVSEDHTANSPPPCGAPMASSINNFSSPSNDDTMTTVVSPQRRDIEDEICNGLNVSIDENLNQDSTENGDVEAEGNPEDTLQQTCNENDLVERQLNDSESKNSKPLGMVEDKHATMHGNLNQDLKGNGDLEAEGDPEVTFQQTCNENDFVETQHNDLEATDVIANLECVGMVEDKHAGRSVSVKKLPSAIKAPQKVRHAENLGVPRNVDRRRTFYMIRMPRQEDSQLRSKIKLGELQLEEASKKRDVIRAALQLKRANKIGLLDKLKVLREKERACKDIYQKKRVEIDPLQAALKRLKFADIKTKEDDIFSEEDLDNKISRLQHRIQHESIPLKEEKQLIREIKQLESQRSQACANDAEHALLLENFGPKEDLQEHLVILYRDLDVLRAHQSQARLECVPIEKELENFNIKIDELVEQLEAAKRSQAAAATALRELKKCLGEQNAEFYRNKDDIRKAKELAACKNLDDLAVLCHEQVESVLRCWNSDSSFRERYMKNNEHSTVRRLETLDGRSLGPDEEPVLLMSDTDVAVENLPKSSELPGSKKALQQEVGTVEALMPAGPGNKVKKPQDNEVKLQAEKVLQGASGGSASKEKIRDSIKSEEKITQTKGGTGFSSASTVAAPVEDAAAKEVKAAELKERRRQEEIAKAQEAADRKRRQAERAQAKAQLRAQKDAERREKEREKKARKKAAVGAEEVKKPVEEVLTTEDRKRELGVEDMRKDSAKGSSSSSLQGKRGASWAQPPVTKSRRQSAAVGSLLSKRKIWQVPNSWLWASLAVIGTGLAVVFVTKF